MGNVPVSNALSEIGPVTVYAHLQACGVINDHLKECHRYKQLIDQYTVEYVDDME